MPNIHWLRTASIVIFVQVADGELGCFWRMDEAFWP